MAVSVFASVQQVLNLFNQLYAKLGFFLASSLLFLLWCQYQNWAVYLNGGAVQCKPVDSLTKEEVNNRCWEQMACDLSPRGVLIHFLMEVEKVKGRAFLGDRLAELEGEGGKAFLYALSDPLDLLHVDKFAEVREEAWDWNGTALPHSLRLDLEMELTRRVLTNFLLNTYRKGGSVRLLKPWLENVEKWVAAAARLHPLLLEVELSKIRDFRLALRFVLQSNVSQSVVGYTLWNELEMGGAAAVIQTVLDVTERTKARKYVHKKYPPGNACPYGFLQYQYLALAIVLVALHVALGVPLHVSSGPSLRGLVFRVYPEGGLQEPPVRLRGPRFACAAYHLSQWSLHCVVKALALAMFFICYVPILTFLFPAILYRKDEYDKLLSELLFLPPILFLSFFNGVPWNKVLFPVAGFPRFREDDCHGGRQGHGFMRTFPGRSQCDRAQLLRVGPHILPIYCLFAFCRIIRVDGLVVHHRRVGCNIAGVDQVDHGRSGQA